MQANEVASELLRLAEMKLRRQSARTHRQQLAITNLRIEWGKGEMELTDFYHVYGLIMESR